MQRRNFVMAGMAAVAYALLQLTTALPVHESTCYDAD